MPVSRRIRRLRLRTGGSPGAAACGPGPPVGGGIGGDAIEVVVASTEGARKAVALPTGGTSGMRSVAGSAGCGGAAGAGAGGIGAGAAGATARGIIWVASWSTGLTQAVDAERPAVAGAVPPARTA